MNGHIHIIAALGRCGLRSGLGTGLEPLDPEQIWRPKWTEVVKSGVHSYLE